MELTTQPQPTKQQLNLIKELRQFNKLDKNYEEFAQSIFEDTFEENKNHYAITLTLKQTYIVSTKDGNYVKRLTFSECENIGRRFLAHLGRRVWRHNYKRYGKRIKAVWKVENGSYKRRLHLHFAIGNLPKYVKLHWLHTKIEKIKEQITELGKQHDITPIYNKRFNGYLTKELKRHNYDGFFIEH